MISGLTRRWSEVGALGLVSLTRIGLAGLIGGLAFSTSLPVLSLAIFLPLLVFAAASRGEAVATALCFAALATLPGLGAIDCAACWPVVADYVAGVGAFALPWALVWRRSAPAWWVVLAVGAVCLLEVCPPLGLFGSPTLLVAAGVVAPGGGWLGLVAVAMVMGVIAAWHPGVWNKDAERGDSVVLPVAAAAITVVVFCRWFVPTADMLVDWVGVPRFRVQTAVNDGTGTSAESLAWIDDRVQVLPANMPARWDGLAGARLQEIRQQLLRTRGQVIVGGQMGVSPFTGNAIAVLGPDEGMVQGRRWVEDGRLSAWLTHPQHYLLEVRRRRAAVLLGSEVLRSWFAVRMIGEADVAALLLDHADGSLAGIGQAKHAAAWCQLFRIRLIVGGEGAPIVFH